MIPIQNHTEDRGSFVFIRLVLAFMVVFGHSYRLGGFVPEPLAAFSRDQASPDSIAVKGFFILSGYLLMNALARNPSVARFAIRRFFRLIPAFWICLIVSALLVVPLMTEIATPGEFTYWESITQGPRNALTYVSNNFLLHIRQWNVAPIFKDNHFRNSINGSLWTLEFEALFYLMLGIAALLGFARRRWLVVAPFTVAYVACVLFALWRIPGIPGRRDWSIMFNVGFHPGGQGVMLAFAAGMATYAITGGKQLWNGKLFLLASILLIGAMRLGGFALVWPLALPYLILTLCQKLPSRVFGWTADFSYGTYLYAFTIQQCLYAVGVHQFGVWTYFGCAAILSIGCGALSWYLVERPAVALGSQLISIRSNARNASNNEGGAQVCASRADPAPI